ncbi:MAG: DUF2508 family protein [Ruminococcaceae bacterium]|nr:DUF2508 family protein [Oscillospiraceae bacterium]
MNLALPSFLPFGQPCPLSPEERRERKERAALLRRVRNCVSALKAERSNLAELTDPDLIDSHIYHMMSLEAQYRFLLRQARLCRLSADVVDVSLH